MKHLWKLITFIIMSGYTLSIFHFLFRYICLMHLSVLPACISVHYMYVWYLLGLEEREHQIPWDWSKMVKRQHVGTGN